MPGAHQVGDDEVCQCLLEKKNNNNNSDDDGDDDDGEDDGDAGDDSTQEAAATVSAAAAPLPTANSHLRRDPWHGQIGTLVTITYTHHQEQGIQ